MKKKRFVFHVLVICLLMAAVFSVGAAGKQESKKTEPVMEKSTLMNQEAPMLAKLVKEGKLPPLKERLPENPMITDGSEIGTYGGVLNVYSSNTFFFNVPGPEPFINYEPIIGFDEDGSWAQPNIAESYEFSKDGLTMTIHLRKGMKWSDGVDFTANDITYIFDHELGNTDLFPTFPEWLTVDGTPVKAKKLDEYTVQLMFPEPNPTILNSLSHANGCQVTDIWFGFFEPAHYMSQYHPDFMDGGVEEATAMAESLGFSSWGEMYRAAMHQNVFGVMGFPDSPPTLSSYVCVERTSERVRWQRNPYYWKVDKNGNQLPYIDEIVTEFISDPESVNAKIIAGDVDWAQGRVGDLALYVENQENGNYKILQWAGGQTQGLVFNFTAKDPYLRKLFRDIRFRQAVSLSLNRQEIIDLYYLGFGEPAPYYATEVSPYFEKDVYDAAMNYVKYDPAAAKAKLAEIGLTKTNSDGILLRPDGKPLEIIFEFYEPRTDAVVSGQSEVIINYMADIGIKVIPRVVTFPQLQEDVVNNDVDMNFAHYADGLEPLNTIHLHPAVPYNFTWIDSWAIAWAEWYSTEGKSGEEPPQEIKDLYEWWRLMKFDPSEDVRLESGKSIWRQMAEKLYKIGTITGLNQVHIMNKNIKNMPEDMFYGDWAFMRFGPLDPYFYIEGASADTSADPILYEGPPGLGNAAK